LANQENEKGFFSIATRKTIKWLLYWSLIPALFNGLLVCFIIPHPIVFLFGFSSYFIQLPTSLIWLTGVLLILVYHVLRHYGFEFPRVVKRRTDLKKLLILWIIVPLLAYTIPYCVIIVQASLRATPYEPFRWDYAILGYFIYIFLIATDMISYGFYVVVILFTLWLMGIAKLYADYQNEKEQRIHD
jgi:uncharacterized membrane protein